MMKNRLLADHAVPLLELDGDTLVACGLDYRWGFILQRFEHWGRSSTRWTTGASPTTDRTIVVGVRFQVVPAAYVLLLRGADVLLQLRQNTGYRDGHWATTAAGHVERDESVIAAATREAAEEIGVVPAELVPLTTMHRTHGNGDAVDERVDFFFTCRAWTGEPRLLEPSKSADLRWFRLDDLPEPVVPHERFVLAGLLAGNLPAITTFGF